MTQPNKSIERDRPSDPFTAQDAARLFALIDGIRKDVVEKTEELEERIISLQGQAGRIEGSLSENRIGRLELELREAEIDLKNAERNRRGLEEKLNIKKDAVSHSTDTHEKIQTISAYAELEKKKRESDEAFRIDLKRGAIKAAVNVLVGGGVLSIVGFFWWLVQLYVNRGGP